MSFIGKLFTLDVDGGADPWPDRDYVPTEALRDWWVAECWFHKDGGMAAAHYDSLMKWVSENPPDSLPARAWAPNTKVRIDLTCLKEAPTRETEKAYRNGSNRYHVVAFCFARNEYSDIRQYQSVCRQSEEFEALAARLEAAKATLPSEGIKVTPEWYHEMIVKTAGSCWVGYHGLEDRKLADVR